MIACVVICTSHGVIQLALPYTDPWRERPVAVTAYSYMFGSLFIGVSSLYFVITGQTSEFSIPITVS